MYNLDPNRTAADPTGLVQAALALTRLPNNFNVGDGLNTAGYTWQQPLPFPRLQWDFKIDHYFTPSERLSVGYTHENNNNPNANQAQPFPTVPGGTITSFIRVFSLNMLSSLKPNLINEFHGGFHRPNQEYPAPWDPACQCAPALSSAGGASSGPGFLPKIDGKPFQLGFSQVTSPYGTDNSNTNPIGPYARISPVYQYGDTLSWLKDRHAFKFGNNILDIP